VGEAGATAEGETALDMTDYNVRPGAPRNGDKNYDTANFVAGYRERGCAPHVAQNKTHRRSANDRHPAIGSAPSTVGRSKNHSADEDRRLAAPGPSLPPPPGGLVFRSSLPQLVAGTG
jgi:hypothetical protein